MVYSLLTLLCRWQTKIVLNLKESHLTSNMAKKFNDIQPSLLLFLHRLRSITVQDQVHYKAIGELQCMKVNKRYRKVSSLIRRNFYQFCHLLSLVKI